MRSLWLDQPTNAAMPHVTLSLAEPAARGYQSGGVPAASAVIALARPSTENLHISTGPRTESPDLPFAVMTMSVGASG